MSCFPAYGRQGQTTALPSSKSRVILWTFGPKTAQRSFWRSSASCRLRRVDGRARAPPRNPPSLLKRNRTGWRGWLSQAPPSVARPLRYLLLQPADELTGRVRVGGRFDGPQHDQRAGVGGEEQSAAADLEGIDHLGESLSTTLTIAVAHDQLADDRDVSRRNQRDVDRQGLALQLQLRIEVVADQGVEETRVGARAPRSEEHTS